MCRSDGIGKQVLRKYSKYDATTSGKTTVGSMTVGSTTVDSIPFSTI